MGCGESKHAVSTQDSTISQSKRSNSKKNAEENVVINGGGDGNVVIDKESDGDALKVVKVDQNVKDGGDKDASSPAVANGDCNVKEEVEKVDQVVLEKQIDQPKRESMVETVKEEGKDKEGSPSTPLPPAVANGDGNVKEGEKVDQVVLEKQIDQPKEESMVETVKEAEHKEASPPPPPPPPLAAAVDDHNEAKGGEEKKGLKGENYAEPEMENAEILAQPTDTDASKEKKDSGKVQEPIKQIEIETHQEANNDKDLEDQKEPKIETGEAEAVESAETKDSAQNDADEKIPVVKGEIEVESAAEAEKKAD